MRSGADMKLEILALRAEHFEQLPTPVFLSPPAAETLCDAELSGVAKLDGRVVAAAGIFPEWQGRGRAWILADMGGDGLPLRVWVLLRREIRATLKRAEACGYRRIDATVDASFAGGIAFAESLGFVVEGYAEQYGPDGRDHLFYAWLADPKGGQG